MAFHEYGGHDTGGIFISLPQWILEIGKNNQDIFFTDREGRRNTECLSWGIDKERVLKGRTGIEVVSCCFIHLCFQVERLMIQGFCKLLGSLCIWPFFFFFFTFAIWSIIFVKLLHLMFSPLPL